MTPRDLIGKWVERFNCQDVDGLADMYSEEATNYQVPLEPVVGREAIRQMFMAGFRDANMTCVPVNIFEDGDWGILEWRDPLGLQGCGFFEFRGAQIVFQRGYWDRSTFERLQAMSKETIKTDPRGC